MISLAVRCLARSSPASRRPTSVDTAFSMFAAIMPKDPQLNCGHPLRTHSSEFVQSRIEGYLSDDLPLRHTVGLTMYSIRTRINTNICVWTSALIAALVFSGNFGQALTSSLNSGYICNVLSKPVDKTKLVFSVSSLIIETCVFPLRGSTPIGSILY